VNNIVFESDSTQGWRNTMATYISFLNFTEQGVKAIKDLPARIAAGRQACEANGGKLLNYYLRRWVHRMLWLFMRLLMMKPWQAYYLQRQALGNLRTTSMRAFTESEIPGILSKMP